MIRNIKYIPNKLLVIMVLTVLSCPLFNAHSDEVIEIVSPEEGTIVRPGETITVVVEPVIDVSLEVVYVGFPKELGYPVRDTNAPYELELTLPNDKIGPVEIEAAAHGEDDSVVFSDFVQVEMQPEGGLESFTVRPMLDVDMSFISQEKRLQIWGRFEDGTETFLNKAEYGTIYQTKSGTNDVIEVSENGVVTARGNGEDTVIISNSGITKEVKFKVNITNTLPILNFVENQILEAGTVKEIAVAATDPDGDNLEYYFAMPEYGSFIDHGNGTATVIFSPQESDVGRLFFWDFHVFDNGNPSLADIHPTRFIQVFPPPVPPPAVNMNLSKNALETVASGEKVTVSWRVEYAASCLGKEGLSGSLKALGGGFVVVYPEETTTYVVECTGPGGTTSDSRTVEVEGAPVNHAPEITDGPEADDDEILENTTTEVSVAAFDPDGDALDYDWSATGGSITGTGAVVTYLAPRVKKDTTYTVSVTISDGRGGSVSGSVDILVKNKTTGGGRP